MNVYWTGYNTKIPFLFYEEPVSLLKEILKTKTDYKQCPAVRDFAKQTFVLKFPVDYNIMLDDNIKNCRTTFYDQDFYNDFVILRSYEEKLITLSFQFLFVAEESLKIEVTGAHYSDNSFTQNALIIPGEYDIGNWGRPVDCTFHMRENVDVVTINSGDAFAYVKFLTDEPINLVKFEMTDVLKKKIASNVDMAKELKSKQFPLSKWYQLYRQTKSKESILKEIKQNLL